MIDEGLASSILSKKTTAFPNSSLPVSSSLLISSISHLDMDASHTHNEQSFPCGNFTLPFWRSEPHKLDEFRSIEALFSVRDVVIIGGGYSGASAAYHLLKNDIPSSAPPLKVVLLEARQSCSGATGRKICKTTTCSVSRFMSLSLTDFIPSGSHLRLEINMAIPKLIERYSTIAAMEITDFEVSQLATIKDLAEEENIDGDFCIHHSDRCAP